MDRQRGTVAGVITGLALIAGLVGIVGAGTSRIDSENVYAICLKVQAQCEDPSPGPTTTTTLPPTTSSTTSTTVPPTTTSPVTTVNISVAWNGSVAHVEVTPNNGAIVVIRGPNGVVVSRGATGDIPSSACCSTPGTYTWTAEPNTGFTPNPPSGSFIVGTPTTAPTTTTAPGPTTTTTTLPPTTTTTVPSGGESYVNPINTGYRGDLSALTLYTGSLTFTSNTTIEGRIVRGEVRVCGNITVTFRDVLWQPTSTNAGGRAFQVDGSNGGGCTGTNPTLILDHVTIDGNGQTQRGVSSQRGGVAQVYFADISGVEDCMNTQGGSASRRNIMADSYCHDLDSPASSPHHDGYQIMGGHALIERSVILVPNNATAAIFPKSDAGAITATFRENYLNGGTYTARRCEGSAVTTWTNNEIGPTHQFGAILGPQGGCTANVSGDVQVTYTPGGNGWHPGGQT